MLCVYGTPSAACHTCWLLSRGQDQAQDNGLLGATVAKARGHILLQLLKCHIFRSCCQVLPQNLRRCGEGQLASEMSELPIGIRPGTDPEAEARPSSVSVLC